jgi:glycerate dehydrogenase
VIQSDISLANESFYTQEIIQSAPRLNFTSVLAFSYSLFDIAEAKQRGLGVSNVPDYGTNTAA